MKRSEGDSCTPSFSGDQPVIPEYFNIGRACTRAGLAGPAFCPDQPAIIVHHGEVDGENTQIRELSYAELESLSNRFAHALLAQGLVKGDRVLLWLPNCVEFPIAFFACLKAGLIAVPASIMLAAEELEYLANDSGARLLVTNGDLWSRLIKQVPAKHGLEQVILTEAFASSMDPESHLLQPFDSLLNSGKDEAIDVQTRAEDPAYLVYTSGTTGYPKGVLHAHRALIGRLPAGEHWFNYQDSGDRILHSGKFNWTYVLGTALMDPLYRGQTVVVHEGASGAATWPGLIARHQCSIFIGVPTIYRQIIQKTRFGAADVPSLRHCMSAGEHLSDEMLHAWQARFVLDIYEAIGMSECSYYLSQHPARPLRPGSAGIPQPGHHVALLDEQMNEVGIGQEGMLCIGLDDPGLFLEYWRRPEETASLRREGYFLTGDYARRDEDGYIWFHGRRDDIINSFGYRISPHEIERVLKSHAHVADCVALGQAVSADKVLVVVCVIAQPGLTLMTDTLLSYAAEHLAAYKVPKAIHVMEGFPRTANGKVIRRQLRKQLPALD